MPTWSFHLVVNQPLTREQSDAFDHCDAFADGSVGYVLGPENPELFPVCSDPEELRKLPCDVEAPSLLDAVARVARDIRLIPGLRAVGVRHEDEVVLSRMAQRCERGLDDLERLAKEPGFPAPVFDLSEDGGSVFYSWREVAAYLRSLGDVVPERVPELVVADLALRLAEAVEGVDVPPGSLRALGLRVD
ncbi:hypothetical protein NX801_24050 [Streptomyces sp. LP05-1]|uniref:Uncharacterized protein n=1 Tax=Streptomyces pyxinae TaxID=2970734 RepID=A0ABT2CPT4_9ACTN|nr:hypothetical protein [Streptomyces sp. LP05-1]MCS0638671.1 hypothetical protein [Streptomyces sp. LP05-1]